jgi:hypothetical protein
MSLIDKPVDELDVSDIARACADGMAEGAQFEIKSSRPSKDGSSPAVLTDFARNKIVVRR